MDVNEFTAAGELVPTDPVEWLDDEDCPAGFQLAGAIGDGQEMTAGEIFQEPDTTPLRTGRPLHQNMYNDTFAARFWPLRD